MSASCFEQEQDTGRGAWRDGAAGQTAQGVGWEGCCRRHCKVGPPAAETSRMDGWVMEQSLAYRGERTAWGRWGSRQQAGAKGGLTHHVPLQPPDDARGREAVERKAGGTHRQKARRRAGGGAGRYQMRGMSRGRWDWG